jgi:hypothetical protein
MIRLPTKRASRHDLNFVNPGVMVNSVKFPYLLGLIGIYYVLSGGNGPPAWLGLQQSSRRYLVDDLPFAPRLIVTSAAARLRP